MILIPTKVKRFMSMYECACRLYSAFYAAFKIEFDSGSGFGFGSEALVCVAHYVHQLINDR